MISRLHRRRRKPSSELQITAFMNLMVVLVPFLLITAVFSQMAVIDLALPEPADPTSDEPPLPPGLRVEIRGGTLVLHDGDRESKQYARDDSGAFDLTELGEALLTIKQRRPDEERITLLLEPDVPYDDLVRVMDAVRLKPGTRDEMFPAIAIGDAPESP